MESSGLSDFLSFVSCNIFVSSPSTKHLLGTIFLWQYDELKEKKFEKDRKKAKLDALEDNWMVYILHSICTLISLLFGVIKYSVLEESFPFLDRMQEFTERGRACW